MLSEFEHMKNDGFFEEECQENTGKEQNNKITWTNIYS